MGAPGDGGHEGWPHKVAGEHDDGAVQLGLCFLDACTGLGGEGVQALPAVERTGGGRGRGDWGRGGRGESRTQATTNTTGEGAPARARLPDDLDGMRDLRDRVRHPHSATRVRIGGGDSTGVASWSDGNGPAEEKKEEGLYQVKVFAVGTSTHHRGTASPRRRGTPPPWRARDCRHR